VIVSKTYVVSPCQQMRVHGSLLVKSVIDSIHLAPSALCCIPESWLLVTHRNAATALFSMDTVRQLNATFT